MDVNLSEMTPGDALPDHVCGPISRTTLALFAGGSGDHMPIHIDLDFARKFGLKDVFAHGMLSMAYLGQLLTRTVRQENIRSYKTRFTAITPVGATVTCSGTLVDLHEEDGERRARLALRTQIDDGTVTMEGEAIVALA